MLVIHMIHSPLIVPAISQVLKECRFFVLSVHPTDGSLFGIVLKPKNPGETLIQIDGSESSEGRKSKYRWTANSAPLAAEKTAALPGPALPDPEEVPFLPPRTFHFAFVPGGLTRPSTSVNKGLVDAHLLYANIAKVRPLGDRSDEESEKLPRGRAYRQAKGQSRSSNDLGPAPAFSPPGGVHRPCSSDRSFTSYTVVTGGEDCPTLVCNGREELLKAYQQFKANVQQRDKEKHGAQPRDREKHGVQQRDREKEHGVQQRDGENRGGGKSSSQTGGGGRDVGVDKSSSQTGGGGRNEEKQLGQLSADARSTLEKAVVEERLGAAVESVLSTFSSSSPRHEDTTPEGLIDQSWNQPLSVRKRVSSSPAPGGDQHLSCSPDPPIGDLTEIVEEKILEAIFDPLNDVLVSCPVNFGIHNAAIPQDLLPLPAAARTRQPVNSRHFPFLKSWRGENLKQLYMKVAVGLGLATVATEDVDLGLHYRAAAAGTQPFSIHMERILDAVALKRREKGFIISSFPFRLI